MAGDAEYHGPAIDGSVQWITERPELDEDDQDDSADETVYATPPEPEGEATVENVPVPIVEPPDVEGQTTFADWGGEQA